MVIFSQYRMMLDQLQRFLELHGYPYERIDGCTSSLDRSNAIDRFTDGERAWKATAGSLLICC